MKIYVWERSFTDYTDGLLVVIAKNYEQAMDIAREKVGYNHEDLAKKPDIYSIKEPNGWFIHGGG